MMNSLVAVATAVTLDPLPAQLNWTNEHGGPLVDRGDPIERLVARAPPSAPPGIPAPLPAIINSRQYKFSYERHDGHLPAGNDLATVTVDSVQAALDACSATIPCIGVTYNSSGVNGTITRPTSVFLKGRCTYARGKLSGAAPWSTWYKQAPVTPPATTWTTDEGMSVGLRQGSFTVQWLNVTGRPNVTNLSFVGAGGGLPLIQHLGDATLRVRPAGASTASWSFFSSSWGVQSENATPLEPATDEIAAHDITPLLEATAAPGGAGAYKGSSPLRVRRAYVRQPLGFGMTFTLTNAAAEPVEVGAFGMAMPAAVSQDVHIGGAHGWVEWTRVHIADSLEVDEQCVLATPWNAQSRLENWRPIFEWGGGANEWSVHTKAWAAEWELNRQWPYLYMTEQLNATGLWPHPKSPWPGWADGGATVRTNFSSATHWNPPTSLVLRPGASVTYGVKLTACPGGPRTRDAALAAAGEPVMRAVPGYTLASDMQSAALFVTLPARLSLASVNSSSNATLEVVSIERSWRGDTHTVRVGVRGLARGRARLQLTYSDGSASVAHYMVLPPLPTQIARVAKHWSEVAWLPHESTDPFGRGASVMPWDRETQRIRLDDARAYDVGLSDDAGAANNLGLATSQAYAPRPSAVRRLDEYASATLYGTKPDTAKPPYKSLQLPEPNFGVRMTLYYYNQTYFEYNYTEYAECTWPGVAPVGGLNYNWCMTESQANATYRGFNYPHQIAVWYALYRVARNHPQLEGLAHPWQFYLEMAANTTLRLGWARIGYMDGTVCREVLRSVLEEAAEAAAAGRWADLGQRILAGEKGRADYFVTAANPYGSEFSYDTTGQEEVVVWLLYFGHDAAALRTVNHVLQYMRPLPNWAYNGGAQAGDVANGGKWLTSAGTGRGDSGKMHYRAGLNQIPLIEWFRRHPDDRHTLEIAVGAMSGQMANIDASGAPAIYFHDFPHVMDFDPYNGDYGLGFFGSSLEASATLVFDQALGALCYLCDLTPPRRPPAAASADVVTLEPRDAYRQRVYLEPLGLYVQADSGTLEALSLHLSERRILVTFAAAAATPAGTRTYDVLRLRVDKVALADAKRPGANFRLVDPPGVPHRRDAYEIPAQDAELTVTIAYDL